MAEPSIETREYLQILYDSDLNSSTSSLATGTDSTVSNLPGAGRVLGETLSFLGNQLERGISILAVRSGQGPDAVRRKIEATLRNHQSSRTLSKGERKRVVQDIQRLLEYTSSPFFETQVQAFIAIIGSFQGKALAFSDCLQSANYSRYFSTFPQLIKPRRRQLTPQQHQALLRLSKVASGLAENLPQLNNTSSGLSQIQEEGSTGPRIKGRVSFREGLPGPSTDTRTTRVWENAQDIPPPPPVFGTPPRGRAFRVPALPSRYQDVFLRANTLPPVPTGRRVQSEGPPSSRSAPTSPSQPSTSKRPQNVRTSKNNKSFSLSIKALNLFGPKKPRPNKKLPASLVKTNLPTSRSTRYNHSETTSSHYIADHTLDSGVPYPILPFTDPPFNTTSSVPTDQTGNTQSTLSARQDVQGDRSQISSYFVTDPTLDPRPQYPPLPFSDSPVNKPSPLPYRRASISSSHRSGNQNRRTVSPTPKERPRSVHFGSLDVPRTPTGPLSGVQDHSVSPPLPSIDSMLVSSPDGKADISQPTSISELRDDQSARKETDDFNAESIPVNSQFINLKETENLRAIERELYDSQITLVDDLPAADGVTREDPSKSLVEAAPILFTKVAEAPNSVQVIDPSIFGRGIGKGWWLLAMVFILTSKYWFIAIAVTVLAYSLESRVKPSAQPRSPDRIPPSDFGGTPQ